MSSPPWSYYVDHLDVSIWANPDLPNFREWLDEDGPVEFDCPNPDGCPGTTPTIEIDGDDGDFEEMLEWLEDHDGTVRCTNCDEPFVGIRGDGDHDDGFEHTGWFMPSKPPLTGGNNTP